MRNHLFFLSTDPHASPFDVNIALDSGFDVVIPYPMVTPENTESLTHDIIFSRGPKGTSRSGIFIGGSDVALTEKIAGTVRKSMFAPFTVSTFSDPKGAYTTAAALTAKTGKAAGGLKDKRAMILGGTGPVGSLTAVLCAREGAIVTIVTSRDQVAGDRVAAELEKNYSVKIGAASASTEDERLALMKKSDIAIAAVKAGVKLMSKEALEKIESPLLIADVNATPPYGFEGLEPNDDEKQISGHVRGIGALATGAIKHKVETGIFKSMLQQKITAGLDTAYELAKTLV